MEKCRAAATIRNREFQGHLTEFQSDFDFAQELSKMSPEIPRNLSPEIRKNSPRNSGDALPKGGPSRQISGLATLTADFFVGRQLKIRN
jgi:hypothetical protein